MQQEGDGCFGSSLSTLNAEGKAKQKMEGSC